jgi:hypothetical protein
MEDMRKVKTAKQVRIDVCLVERCKASETYGNNMEENRKSITFSGVRNKRNIMVNNG